MYVTRHVYLLSVVLATADRTFKANNTKKCTNVVLMVSIFWLKLGCHYFRLRRQRFLHLKQSVKNDQRSLIMQKLKCTVICNSLQSEVRFVIALAIMPFPGLFAKCKISSYETSCGSMQLNQHESISSDHTKHHKKLYSMTCLAVLISSILPQITCAESTIL